MRSPGSRIAWPAVFAEPDHTAARRGLIQEWIMFQNLGAVLLEDGRCRFRVWAPLSERVHVEVIAPRESVVCLQPRPLGYHTAVVEGISPGTRYRYRLSNGKEFPDPVSRFQ